MNLPKTKMKFRGDYGGSLNGHILIFIEDGIIYRQNIDLGKDDNYPAKRVDTVEKAESLMGSIERDIKRVALIYRCETKNLRKEYEEFFKELNRMIKKAKKNKK